MTDKEKLEAVLTKQKADIQRSIKKLEEALSRLQGNDDVCLLPEDFDLFESALTVLIEHYKGGGYEHIGWAREWEGDSSDLGNYVIERCLPDEPQPDEKPNWFPLYTRTTALDKLLEEKSDEN